MTEIEFYKLKKNITDQYHSITDTAWLEQVYDGERDTGSTWLEQKRCEEAGTFATTKNAGKCDPGDNYIRKRRCRSYPMSATCLAGRSKSPFFTSEPDIN